MGTLLFHLREVAPQHGGHSPGGEVLSTHAGTLKKVFLLFTQVLQLQFEHCRRVSGTPGFTRSNGTVIFQRPPASDNTPCCARWSSIAIMNRGFPSECR